MALDPQLSKFRAPGTKILTTVEEQIPVIEAPSGARLLVINARKGPVNKAILVRTWTEFKNFFGNISIAEERKGEFGRRSAYYMLQASPIYVINLRSFDDTVDLAGKIELSTSASVANSAALTEAYSKLFNKQQFWNIDPKKLIASSNTTRSLVFANVGSENLSVFVRKSKNVRTSLTFDQWYKNLGRTRPEFVYPEDKVADWYVDVVIFDNSFDLNASANAAYGHLFDAKGRVKRLAVNELGNNVDALTQLTAIPEAGFVGTITGCLIPGFIDEAGNNADVVELINAQVERIGLIAKINDDIFDDAEIWNAGASVVSNGKKQPLPVDFVGHALSNINSAGNFDQAQYSATTNIQIASYYIPTNVQVINNDTSEAIENGALSSQDADTTLVKLTNVVSPAVVTNDGTTWTYKRASENQLYVVEETKVGVGEKFIGADGNLSTVRKSEFVGATRQVAGLGTVNAPVMPYNNDAGVTGSNDWDDAAGNSTGYTYTDSGDLFPKHVDGHYIYPVGHPLAGLPLVYSTATGYVVHNPTAAENTANLYSFGRNTAGTEVPLDFGNLPAGYTSPDATRQYIEPVDIDRDRMTDAKWAAILTAVGTERNVYLLTFDKAIAFNNTASDTTNVDKAQYTSTGADRKSSIILTDSTTIDVWNKDVSLSAYKVVDFDKVTEGYVPLSMKAYVPRTAQFVDGTAARQKTILDMLTSSSLRSALTNRELISFNYIVDGFKSYIEPSIKVQLKTIAKERQLCRAIYNMPSIEDFQESTNPYFKQTTDSEFDPKYIPLGGNLQLPYTNTFSIPNVDGWYAYGFGPNLLVKDGGRTISMPPAGVVSNNFQRKYQSGNPYDIVAGPGVGTISGAGIFGVEYTFNESNVNDGDRGVLDPFGFNVILNKRATGLQIYSNVTSLNTIETPLRSIHTSESLMFIQDQINRLLERHVFSFNTAQNRLVIKTEADKICQRLVDDGAITGFLNQMDEQNNNADVINARIGLLDTTLIANNGMEIAVHRTKINGVQNSTSFELL